MSEEQPLEVRRRRSRSGFCLGCVVGCGLLLVTVIALGIGVRRSPGKFPVPLRTIFGAKEEAGASPAASGLTPEQLEALRGVKPTVEVTLREEDLNSYLEQHPNAVGLPKGFAAPRVEFREGLVVASIRTRVLVPVRVVVAMRPETKGGRITLSVVKVKAGKVSLPGEFRQQIQGEMERLIAERIEKSGFEPQSVEVGERRLTITGELTTVADS